MVSFEYTNKIKEHVSFVQKHANLSEEERSSLDKLNSKTKTISIENLQLLSSILQREETTKSKNKPSAKYIHELVEGSNLILSEEKETTKKEPKKELQERLERLKRLQEQREYDRITRDVRPELVHQQERVPVSVEVKDMQRQIAFGVNVLMTCVGMFFFGYKVFSSALGTEFWGYMGGILCAAGLLLVEALLYIIYTNRRDEQEVKEKQKKIKKMKITPSAPTPLVSLSFKKTN